MPTCKKCSRSFPNQLKIGEKRHNLQRRKYCLDCSPFGKHNTKQIEEKDERVLLCQLCNKEYIYVHKMGHTLSFCFCCITKQRRIARKKRMIEYKGGKCSRCGYNKSTRALSFHHRDRDQKSFNIGGSYTISWKRLQVELNKCDLLCSNCHMEIEDELLK